MVYTHKNEGFYVSLYVDTEVKVTNHATMENNSEKIEYELPETPIIKEYGFSEISLSIEGDSNPQPPSHTRILILPTDAQNAHLTYSMGDISSYSRTPIKTEDIKTAIFRKGVSEPLYQSNCEGSISLETFEPGEYFLYIGNAEPSSKISFISYKRLGNGVAFSFRLFDNGKYCDLPEILGISIFCYHSVRIVFKTPISRGNSWLSYEYSRVGNNKVISSKWLEISSDGTYVNMGPGEEFIDGEYKLKLYLNNNMKAQIRFNVKNFEVTDFELE